MNPLELLKLMSAAPQAKADEAADYSKGDLVELVIKMHRDKQQAAEAPVQDAEVYRSEPKQRREEDERYQERE